jgi:hypothetical protein
MRLAVQLWRWVERRDSAALRRVLHWEKRGVFTGWVYYEEPKPEPGKPFAFIKAPQGVPFHAGDAFTPAGFLVQRRINDGLRGNTSTALLWDVRQHKRVLRIVPTTLLGALWWQFARVIAGEAKYRECPICHEPMEISSGSNGKNANVVFCSSACRQENHRAKVKAARALKAEGKTVRQIAKHFDTTPDTIQNWLTKEK